MKDKIQQAINALSLSDLPVCQLCQLTEQRARCDISKCQKQKCGLTLCRKCQQLNPDGQCPSKIEGCKKKIKEHRLKNLVKQKLKNNISFRFENESKYRSKLKIETKYADIDEDMTHILCALLGESSLNFNIKYKKQVERLVDDLKKMKNTIESHSDRANLPVFKEEIFSKVPDEDNGILACGYIKDDYSKGIDQILRIFY